MWITKGIAVWRLLEGIWYVKLEIQFLINDYEVLFRFIRLKVTLVSYFHQCAHT